VGWGSGCGCRAGLRFVLGRGLGCFGFRVRFGIWATVILLYALSGSLVYRSRPLGRPGNWCAWAERHRCSQQLRLAADVVEVTERQVAEADLEDVALGLEEAEAFTNERAGHEDLVPSPLEVPAVSNAAQVIRPREVRLGKTHRHLALGPLVEVAWDVLRERFVRALVVEDATETIEAALSREQRCRSWLARVTLQRQVKALVLPVLLRMSRLDALVRDAESMKQHTHLRQAARRRRRKRGSVVRTHRAWQPVAGKIRE